MHFDKFHNNFEENLTNLLKGFESKFYSWRHDTHNNGIWLNGTQQIVNSLVVTRYWWLIVLSKI